MNSNFAWPRGSHVSSDEEAQVDKGDICSPTNTLQNMNSKLAWKRCSRVSGEEKQVDKGNTCSQANKFQNMNKTITRNWCFRVWSETEWQRNRNMDNDFASKDDYRVWSEEGQVDNEPLVPQQTQFSNHEHRFCLALRFPLFGRGEVAGRQGKHIFTRTQVSLEQVFPAFRATRMAVWTRETILHET